MTHPSGSLDSFGSDEMRLIWSDGTRRRLWRRIWLAQAEALAAAEVLDPATLPSLRTSVDAVDLIRAADLEASGRSKVAAELSLFLEHAPAAEQTLLSGMTSADVLENAEVLLQRTALSLLLGRLRELLIPLAEMIEQGAAVVILPSPTLGPCAPTTLGYHLALYGQELHAQLARLDQLRTGLQGIGLKGAAGTGASLQDLLESSNLSPAQFESRVLASLKLEAVRVADESMPRSQDLVLQAGLAGLAASLRQLNQGWRSLLAEGLVVGGDGESARKSLASLDGLAQLVASGAGPAWQAAAEVQAERSLSLATAFLALDGLLIDSTAVIRRMQIDEASASQQVERFGPFCLLERLAAALVRQGAGRDEVDERLRVHRQAAWEAARQGQPQSLLNRLAADTALLRYLQPAALEGLLDARTYVGWAPQRARETAALLRNASAASH